MIAVMNFRIRKMLIISWLEGQGLASEAGLFCMEARYLMSCEEIAYITVQTNAPDMTQSHWPWNHEVHLQPVGDSVEFQVLNSGDYEAYDLLACDPVYFSIFIAANSSTIWSLRRYIHLHGVTFQKAVLFLQDNSLGSDNNCS